jgi:toxin ParE1/3/4
MQFRLLKRAMDDLISIGRYTQQTWGREQRNKYLSMLDNGFYTIAQQPEIGVACDFIRSGYRKYHVGRHLIFYRISTTHIEIVRILHERMDIPNHLVKN